MPELDLLTLRECLSYNPETGHFYWLISLRKGTAGKRAGQVTDQGYWLIRLFQKNHKAHRLAWFYVHGVWPKCDIDHINGDRADNRLCNLRLATRSQNLANSRLKDCSTSGLKGAYLDKRRNLWTARITVRNKNKFLGYFDTKEEAHEAYVTAARKQFGEFARAA